MGMAQAGSEPSLRHDALTHAVLLGEIRSEQLEGDLPVESQVMGREDFPHAAVTEPLAQPVSAADGFDLIGWGHPAPLSLGGTSLHIVSGPPGP